MNLEISQIQTTNKKLMMDSEILKLSLKKYKITFKINHRTTRLLLIKIPFNSYLVCKILINSKIQFQKLFAFKSQVNLSQNKFILLLISKNCFKKIILFLYKLLRIILKRLLAIQLITNNNLECIILIISLSQFKKINLYFKALNKIQMMIHLLRYYKKSIYKKIIFH